MMMVVSGLHGRNSVGRGLEAAAASGQIVILMLLRRMLVLLLVLLMLILLTHHVLLLDKMLLLLLLHGLRGLLVLLDAALGAARPAANTRRVGG